MSSSICVCVLVHLSTENSHLNYHHLPRRLGLYSKKAQHRLRPLHHPTSPGSPPSLKLPGPTLEHPSAFPYFHTIFRILTTRLPPFLSPPTGLVMVARGISFFFFSICVQTTRKTEHISNQRHHDKMRLLPQRFSPYLCLWGRVLALVQSFPGVHG